jgi:hypothetical protein
MLSPQVMYDDMKQGLNYTATGDLVIMSVDSPKPGDLFNFYVNNLSYCFILIFTK